MATKLFELKKLTIHLTTQYMSTSILGMLDVTSAINTWIHDRQMFVGTLQTFA